MSQYLISTDTVPLTSISQIEHAHLTIDATLADLPHYTFQVEGDTLVLAVDQTFKAQPGLLGVLITENNLAVGVISRRKFYEQLGQLYGVAVYLKRPVGVMLQAIGGEPLHLPGSYTITAAATLALHRPHPFVYEPVVVELAPQTYRLVDVYTLLIAQSRLLDNLQRELQQSNNELEARVQERTAELQRLNASMTREIVRRRQVEQKLISARDEALDASRFKTELLANVSHELRTPLGGILGTTEMLELGIYGPLNEAQQNIAAQIIKNANYLTDMVNQLLDQAKLEAGRLHLTIGNFSPAKLVEEAVAKMNVAAQNKKLQLITQIDPQLPPLLAGDQFRIQQILLNLVGNAVKFTERGAVRICLAGHDAAHWAIHVTDTGPGIPAEAHAVIFEPFGQVDSSITREHSGTGLGLSIVKQLTDLMGGQILLDSAAGRGSEFTVILPLLEIQEKTV